MRRLALALLISLSATPAFAQCDFDFEDMVGKMQAAPSVRFETTTEVHGAPALHVTGAIGAAGAVHIRNDVQGQVSELIAVDGKAWLKADGQWQALPDHMAAQILQTAQAGMEGGVVVAEGLECIEGPDGLIALTLAGSTSSLTMVVNAASGLPRSVSHQAPGMETRTTYDFDQQVQIVAPL